MTRGGTEGPRAAVFGGVVALAGVVRRVRAFAGQFLLLGVLALVAALLVTGVPRTADRLAEQGLREHVAGRPAAERDLTLTAAEAPAGGGGVVAPVTATRGRELDTLQAGLPEAVRRAVQSRWFLAETAFGRLTGPDLAAKNYLVVARLRAAPGVTGAATLTEGRWPAEAVGAGQPVEVALADDTARKLNLRAGSRLRFSGAGAEPVPLLVVGVFEPARTGDGIWNTLPSALRVTEPAGDEEPYEMVALTSDAGLDAAIATGVPVRFSWRYRLGGLDVADLGAVVDGVRRLERTPPAGLSVTQAVDVPLRQFLDAVSAARTLLAVIAAGMFATVAGLIVLAARLAARRREAEFALLVARGGAPTSGARRSLAESALVVPPAAALGWLLGRLLPGSTAGTAGTDWLVLVAAALATLALPLATLGRSALPGGRRDLSGRRAGGRRLTLELLVVALAVLATFLIRRRGLSPGSVDPLLVSVPVLLAVAAAVLVLRLYPWPLRLLGRVAARTRGSVTFLGVAGASRSAATGPVVVVVVAVATAAFCGVVAGGIESGRDRTATTAVPASALVDGERLAPDTGAALQRLPGVRRSTPVLREGALRVADARGVDAGLAAVTVLLVDGPGLAETARDAGVDVSVPPVLRAGRSPGPAPALVSPGLAAELARAGLDGTALVTLQGYAQPFRVADTAEGFPLVPADVDRFVVLPWQALPEPVSAGLDTPSPVSPGPVSPGPGTAGPGATGPVPTAFLVSGDGFDVEALRRAGDEGQRRYQTGGSFVAGERPRGAEVTTWRFARQQLGGGGANGLLVFGFAAGAAGGAAFGLLAIAFAVLAGARTRAQVLSRLRTLGLSRRQWRGLLLVELTPLVAAALFTGALMGALLPLLLTPALGLAAFTGGEPVRVAFSPGLVGAVLAAGAVALALAVTVETVNNRRLRLGEVLRLGEGS
ncbi:FtsX-like permease family protein [Micromonospora haikouensis]|uniref:FtsX-like permease family protein n=1 Tax=Micromonospora haikouensis TaxID=686309 RepID=UPI003D8B92A3